MSNRFLFVKIGVTWSSFDIVEDDMMPWDINCILSKSLRHGVNNANIAFNVQYGAPDKADFTNDVLEAMQPFWSENMVEPYDIENAVHNAMIIAQAQYEEYTENSPRITKKTKTRK